MLSVSKLFNALPGGLAEGFIWGIMALGIYITFRILKVSDLTVDGSFATGGATCVVLIHLGVSTPLALVISFFAGILVGTITGLIHTKLKIPAILSGILVQFALFSINLHIMSMKANVSINPDNYNLVISMRNIPKSIIVGAILSIVLVVALYWYFGTAQGSAIRATGNSNQMATAQGVNIDTMKVIGFGLGNGLVALSGALLGQYQGYSDISMGRGAIVIGLAAIIIGEGICDLFFKKGCSFYTRLAFVIVGGIIYKLVMVLILWLRVDTNDLKLFTAIIVMIFLSIPYLKKKGSE